MNTVLFTPLQANEYVQLIVSFMTEMINGTDALL